MKLTCYKIILSMALMLIFTNNALSQCVDVPQSERDALVAFYNATNGANWINNTNWNTAVSVCDWYGVTVTNGNVTQLNLNSNNLVGTIPAALQNLTKLERLNLYINNFSSSTLPVEIGNLSNLEILNLHACQLTADIPIEWGNLTSLKNLSLFNNYLTGTIPSSLGNLTNLTTLSLYNNQLSGTIPPEIGNLNSLYVLDIYQNQFTGSIPEELGNLSSIGRFRLDNNQLSGTIPWQLGNLSTAYQIVLSNNQLTGPLPPELGNLSNITSLLIENNQLTGSISSNFGNLLNVKQFHINNNNLTGSIPTSLGNLLNIERLYLYNNQLSGFIPHEISNLIKLKELVINNNLFSGNIPDLSNITSLTKLRFSNNAFVFSDFEAEHLQYATKLTAPFAYTYNPQAKVDQEETVFLAETDNYTLSTGLTSTNNHYQWQHSIDGGTTWTNVGTDTNTYTITSATGADAGMYRFLATNDIVNGLTLTRNTIFVNVTIDGQSNICLAGTSSVPDKGTVNTTTISLATVDNSEIISLDATITKGFKVGGSPKGIILNENFDIQGNISFSEQSTVAYNSFIIQYTIQTTSGNFQGSERFYAGKDEILTGATYRFECIYTPDNDNTFCLSDYEDEILIANLFPRGNNILWYNSEFGGSPYDANYEIIEEVDDAGGTMTYWWDDTTDTNPNRTSATIIIYDIPEGYTEQTFSAYITPAPTIADIDVENGNDPVYWYDSDVSTTPLSTSTVLVDGLTYYASSCDISDPNCVCRLPVTITLGVVPPQGDALQYLCEQSTLNHIVIQLESGFEVVWYDSPVGGNVLSETTQVTDGATYYAAQKIIGGTDESTERLAILINTIPVNPPIVTKPVQKFYANESQTIADLIAFGYGIKWYSQATGGFEFTDTSTALQDGITYYAEQNQGPCPSGERVGVTVELIPVNAEPLVGCELFRPELLGHYVIDAWVNEREVLTETISGVAFNNNEASDLFVGLLNHLKNRLLSNNKYLRDFPEEYEPEFTGGEPELDFAPLMAYIEGLGVSEKKFMVYDFESVYDSYGRTIGFSFYLNQARNGQFIYKTPQFTYFTPTATAGSGIPQVLNTEHYTLSYNSGIPSDELLNFTNVEINGTNGQFKIYSDFNYSIEPLYSQSAPILIQNNIVGTDSDFNLITPTSETYKYTEVAYQADMTYDKAKIEIAFFDVSNQIIGTPVELSPKGDIIDKWQKITGDFTIPNNAGKMTISLKNTDQNRIVFFDDLRIQPFESNMKTFVYHPENQRLMSELDENNYATFYEYDSEGGLIRVKKETVKGTYTIQETRSGNVKATN